MPRSEEPAIILHLHTSFANGTIAANMQGRTLEEQRSTHCFQVFGRPYSFQLYDMRAKKASMSALHLPHDEPVNIFVRPGTLSLRFSYYILYL